MSEYTAEQVEQVQRRMAVASHSDCEDAAAMLHAYAATLRQQAERCPYCDNTGDVHSIDGEWRGEYHECKARQAERGDGAVSDADIHRLLRSQKPFGELHPSDYERMREAVAPLLRAPAEQGGMVDDALDAQL